MKQRYADESGGLGTFIPTCREDGGFHPVQCWGSVGHCWCVDGQGQEVNGTRVQGVPNCADEGVGALPPDYLSVEGYEQCLGQHQPTGSHSEWCIPSTRPDACLTQSYEQLRQVFTGSSCPDGATPAPSLVHTLIRHRVSAAITWDNSANQETSTSAGYTIEYFETIHDSVVMTASSDIPIFLLDNLIPGSEYQYTLRMRDTMENLIFWTTTGSFVASY